MTCARRACASRCFYCDASVTRHDHDHAPIPARAGGSATVVACPGCHHLKDRIILHRWPLTLAVLAVGEIFELGLMPTAETAGSWPDRWDDMTSHGRVLWAKWAAILLDPLAMEVRLDNVPRFAKVGA